MPPGPMTPTKTTTIDARGAALYAETFMPEGTPSGVVVLTHGYADHCGRYREVAHVIVKAGWAALLYDVRGHGHSPGARGFIDRFETYLDDLDAVTARARTLVPAGAPTVLLGHSHGALITLRALCSDRPPDAIAAIVSSPFLGVRVRIPAYQKVLARVASRVAPGLAQPNKIRVEQLMRDPAKQAEWRADKLNFGIATARWFVEATRAQQYVAQHATHIKVPTTWLVGGADPLTDPTASRRVASSMTGAQYHDYATLLHEVFNESERDQVFAEVTKTLAACGAARA